MDYNYLNHPNQPHHQVSDYVHPGTAEAQHGGYQQSLPLHHPAAMPYPHGVFTHPSHFRIPVSSVHEPMPVVDRSELTEVNRNENVVTMVTVAEHDVHTTLLEMQNAITSGRNMGYQDNTVASSQHQAPPTASSHIPQGHSNTASGGGVPIDKSSVSLVTLQTPNKNRETSSASQQQQQQHHQLQQGAMQTVAAAPVDPATREGAVDGAEDNEQEREASMGGPLPEGLRYKRLSEKSVCVVADQPISKGVRFGPFKGAFGKGPIHFNNILSWELTLEGRVVGFLSPVKGERAWTTMVRCAQYPEEQTAEAFQYCGRIYFSTIRDLNPGDEFKAFYSADYRESCGFRMGLADLKFNTESGGFECSYCPCHCSNSKSLLRHLKLFHHKDHRPGINVELLPQREERGRLPPSTDGTGLGQEAAGRDGAQKTPSNVRFICTTCGKSFPTHGRLLMHEKFHTNIDVAEDGEEIYPCDSCGFTCRTESALDEHIEKHKKAPFGCAECGKVFSTDATLATHRKFHWDASIKAKSAKQGNVLRIKLRVPKVSGLLDICKTCGYACKNSKILHAHMKQHETLPFGCPECGLSYKQKATLLKHLKDKHQAPKQKETPVTTVTSAVAVEKNQCKRCHFQCEDETSFKVHMKKHSIAPYGCDVCGSVFTRPQLVSRHKREAHGIVSTALERSKSLKPLITPWACKICDKSYVNLKTLTKHQQEKHGQVSDPEYRSVGAKGQGPGDFECDLCPETFRTMSGYNKHLQQIHGIEPNPRDMPKGTGKVTAPGSSFREVTYSPDDLLNSPQGSTRCYICGKTFIKFSFLHDHLRQHHGIEPVTRGGSAQPQETSGPVPSEVANPPAEGEDSQDKREQIDMLGKPMDYFNRPRPFKCKQCANRFVYRHDLRRHEFKVHLGGSKFTCSFCQKGFDAESQLLVHVQKHTNNRPFKCHLCPRSFASQSACDNHQGEHTGAKPHKCEVCGRGFGTRKLLNKHKSRLHSNREKKYKCSFCDKRFYSGKDHRVHERRHKGIRPYVCLTCGKAFKDKHCRDVHQVIHTGEKPYACPHCGKAFPLAHRLTDHLVMHQKETMEQAAVSSIVNAMQTTA